MDKYRENKSCQEQRTPADVLKTFSEKEREIVLGMKRREIRYLMEECDILNYVNHLRDGKEDKAFGADFPILVVKGTSFQLEKFKLILLLTLIDYQGVEEFAPNQFSLGEDSLEYLRTYTGVAIIKITKGASTSEGLDMHRTELITSILASRRNLFNPSVVLAEENISGKFNISNTLIKVIRLDNNKLIASQNGDDDTYVDVTTSRKKVTPTYSQSSYNYNNSNSSYHNSSYQNSKYKKKEGRTVNSRRNFESEDEE